MFITDVNELNALLLDALTARHTMQQIMDEVHERAGMQIVIFDLDSQVLVHALGDTRSRIWNFAREKGYLPHSFLEQNTKMGSRLTEIFATGSAAFFEAGEIDEGCHIFHPVYIDGKPEGVLVVGFADRRVNELAGALAEALAKLYSYFTQSDAAGSDFDGDFFEVSFTRELLLHDGDMARNLFGEIYGKHPNDGKAQFSSGYAIAVMCGLDVNGASEELEAAERALQMFLPHSFHLISNGNIMAFLYGLGSDMLPRPNDGLITQLERFSSKYHLYCGISSRFDDLSQRRGYKLQALQALKLGRDRNPSGYVFTADSMYAAVLISGAIVRIGKQILELSDIRKLAEYDEKIHTDYLHTLEQYLKYGNRLSPAADSMFIDRSTMKYRLQKVKSIIEKDIDQPSVAKQLRLGVSVFRLCESRNGSLK
ncbi:MAG TPA: helix-turn-helix domain-containing protein [Anaerovoracaceae bacterium]|nr:helix-turn-helix domain-containing protein [Anaerovoracaceae bacterium]